MGCNQRVPACTKRQSCVPCPVRVSAPALAPAQQGLRVLGVPVGSPQFVAAQLDALAASQRTLLARLPTLEACCTPRCNHVLRLLPPESTAEFAAAHDIAVADCLCTLLQAGSLPPQALGVSRLPLRFGGLGLRSAAAVASVAYWASWADSLPLLERQTPSLLRAVLPT